MNRPSKYETFSDFKMFCNNRKVTLTASQEDAARNLLESKGGRDLFGENGIGMGKTFLCHLLEDFSHDLENRMKGRLDNGSIRTGIRTASR